MAKKNENKYNEAWSMLVKNYTQKYVEQNLFSLQHFP